MIAGAPAVQGLVRDLERGEIGRGETDQESGVPQGFWVSRTAVLLASLLNAKPGYLEARIIQGDFNFKEILHVERDGEVVHDERGHLAPDTGEIAAFRAVFRPGAPPAMASDIQVRSGPAGPPPRRVVELHVPLYDSTNLPFGLVVLTVDLREFFSGIGQLAPPYAEVRAVNAQGQYLMHPDPAVVAGQSLRVEDEYPGFGAAFGTGQVQREYRSLRDSAGQDQGLGVHDQLLGSHDAAHRIRFLYTAPYAAIRAKALANWERVVEAGILAVLFVLPLSLIFGTALARPLRRMTEVITSWTQGSDISGLPVERSDEIGVLAREFVGLLTSLEQRQAQQRVADAEIRRLAAALDSTQSNVIITDHKGDIQYVNPAFEKFSGAARAQVIGRQVREVVDSRVPAADLPRFVAALKARQPWKGLMMTTLPDGRCREEEVNLSPVREPDGTLTHWISVSTDMTEWRKMEAELRQAQKLESIGHLAAGIAHEINTPIQYVGDNIRFVQEAFTDVDALLGELTTMSAGAVSGEELARALERADLKFLREEVPKALEQSTDGCQRVADIVRAMKVFSHPGQEKTPVDLNRAIASTITVASNEWKYVAEMLADLDETLPLVVCMPGEFNQVILNMLVNAAHAIGDVVGDGHGGKGRISVTTRQQGEWAEIRIGDTGGGIAPEIREKIFDPFFTTKQVGKGTGQGLSIAYDVIVNKHGGTIKVESEPGKGSTFIIRLPLAAAGGAAARAA
jgi:PAS domain S-box-containing protein